MGVRPLDREAVIAEEGLDGRAHLAREERIGTCGEPRIDRESLAQGLAARSRRRGERIDRRPRPLGVHVVGGERRHAAPVADPGVEQSELLRRVGKIGRSLDADVRPHHDARRGDGGEELLVVRLGSARHGRPRLRAEVLHDHLLDVPVPTVEVADREDRAGALPSVLADADEDAGGERDREAARVLDRSKPHRRMLVRGTEVRAALRRKTVGGCLEHQSHRCAHLLQPSELLVAHDPRIQVRQQTRLLDHADRGSPHVVERRGETPRAQPLARHVVAVLRAIAQGEQRLLARTSAASPSDGEHLFRREERCFELGRRLGERAVVAVVAAEHRQWDEDLARVGDAVARAEIAKLRGHRLQPHEVFTSGHHELGRLVLGQGLASLGARERPP